MTTKFYKARDHPQKYGLNSSITTSNFKTLTNLYQYSQTINKMKITSILAAGTIIAGIASPAVAVGPQGQAVQINTYTDSICTKFSSNRMMYYGKSPKVGDCFDLNLADGVLSLHTVGVWDKDSSATNQEGSLQGLLGLQMRW